MDGSRVRSRWPGRRRWPARFAAGYRVDIDVSRHAATVLGLLAVLLLLSAPIRAEEGAAALKEESVVLKDGTSHRGTVLDVTDEQVVILTARGKKFVRKSHVDSIFRKTSEKVLDFLRAKEKEVTRASHWMQLADFCKERGYFPEQRAYLRRYLEAEPESEKARIDLGQASLDGEWLSEEEVEARLAKGYTIEEGKLIPPGEQETSAEPGEGSQDDSSKTVVKKEGVVTDTIHIIPRQKLSDREAERLERERTKAIENAQKFREKLNQEYEGVDWSQRSKHQTRNFEIHCNSTLQVTQNYGVLMELIRAKLSEMFRSRVLRRLRAPVFIYCNQEEFMNNDMFARYGGRGLGGYYMPSNQSITTYHGTFGFTGTTFGVLCHEGTHYYQGLVLKGGFDNIPIWLVEGLAVYFGDGSKLELKGGRADLKVGIIPRDRLAHIQEKMLRDRHTPIKKLISMTRRNFSGSHYADAWALIYFLVKSSKEGERLMQAYWTIGLEEPLKDKHFLALADKYFGGVDEMEKQYVDYILKLRPPPAGEVKGDYFTSDTFQFEFKAPGPEWEFYEDLEDKKLLIGLLYPGTSARIRIYYENNIQNKDRKEYFKDYLRLARDLEDFQHEETTIGGLPGYKLTYTDTGKALSLSDIEIEIDEEGNITLPDPRDLEDKLKKAKDPEIRDIIKYMLIQVDGVASIECSTKKGEMGAFRDVFDGINESFRVLLTRRW